MFFRDWLDLIPNLEIGCGLLRCKDRGLSVGTTILVSMFLGSRADSGATDDLHILGENLEGDCGSNNI